ncbi:PQQ-dependent sugar dehydrogenase [Candidatus Nomurabacteria bacterium]|nr:PQQ-dependent sugar dehydrogenase [Candidatus Nomurabacteria bacterium]
MNSTRTRILAILIAIVIIGTGLWLYSYFHKDGAQVESGKKVQVMQADATMDEDQTEPTQLDSGYVPYNIKPVANGLFVPWSVAFPSEGRILVTERSGQVRQIQDGQLQEEPVHVFDEVSTRSEEGLMGMALDPQYRSNHFVYFCYAYEDGGILQDKVVRMIDQGDSLLFESTVIDNIPAAQYHAGCRIKFGPDDKLYVTTGDATSKNIAQDVESLGGKILRLNTDGSIPDDNPIAGSYVYSYGHRNPQGIDWTGDGVLVSTEHGPSTFDGPPGGDEVNVIFPGKNYGWPIVSHDENKQGMESPRIQFTPAVAPGSALVYSGKVFPQWTGKLLFGGLRGEGIYVVSFDQEFQVVEYEKLDIDVGRVREVVEGPDGHIYFTTSNRDGRGTFRAGDDILYSIVPSL